jgi:transposase InsO family protein
MKPIAEALGVSRSNLVEQVSRAPATRPPVVTDDAADLEEIQAVVHARGSYGYRRTTAIIARTRIVEGRPAINHKRVYRLMRDAGLLLARHTGGPKRRHDGQVITLKSDLRWCSDSFEIRCWNGERVQVPFALDCCDREAITHVATTGAITGEMVRDMMAEAVERRFGPYARSAPRPLEWLSDNAPCYTAHETRAFGEALGFIICNTPAYSPESNGMAESFVKGFKRDYVYLNRLETAESVMAQLNTWFEDYNEMHPHRGLRMKSPREYRRIYSPNAACPV